jgi:hypothetical protein
MNGYRFARAAGGGILDLDSLDGNVLNDYDYAIVMNRTSGESAFFDLVAASGATANGTTIIAPTTNPGTKRWHLRVVPGQGATMVNYAFDGDFNVWVEGSSQTTSGYGSDTMSRNVHSGTTKTHSQQSFTVGQTAVPGNPMYYSRTVVNSVAGASNYCIKEIVIPDVTLLANSQVTLSEYLKTDASQSVAIEIFQSFGGGGSATVYTPVEKITTTTSFTFRSRTFNIPSIAGKTLGNTSLSATVIRYWFDSGSAYNSETFSLGQRSGTFDLARVRLVKGPIHGDAIDIAIADAGIAVSRFYQTIDAVAAKFTGNVTSGNNYSYVYNLTTPMLCTGVTSLVSAVNATNVNFPAAVGASIGNSIIFATSPFLVLATAISEVRTANGTGAGSFSSAITANSRP